jgi:hypothetical protein
MANPSQHTFITKETEDKIYNPEWEKVYKRLKGSLIKSTDKLKEYHLEKGVIEVNGEKRSEEDLRKIYKLILEIRWLENKGDATKESDFEKELNNPHGVKDLVGVGAADEKSLDIEFNKYIGKGKFYLVNYFERLAWDGDDVNGKSDVGLAMRKIRESKDDYLEGFEIKDKFELYLEAFKGFNTELGFSNFRTRVVKLIEEELAKDQSETVADWNNKLRTIDALESLTITEDEKEEWEELPNEKFAKVAQVEELIKKVIGSDGKVDNDFLEEAKKKKITLTSLALVLKEKPKDVIALIARYEYNKLDDSGNEEKDKKKTQQKRRLAKASQLSKESDIDDDEKIDEALVKVKTGEITIDKSKYYTADLKEITSKKKNDDDDQKKDTNEKPFLRWDNPWLYGIGALLVVVICTFVWWDKIKGLFGKSESDEN